MTKTWMLAGVAAFALNAAPAWAQDAAPAADDSAPAEIIVTAQKRAERLQDVPVAVSVVSGANVDGIGKPNLEGAQYLVPALTFVKAGTSLNQALFLRGIGTTSLSIAVEPSVSTVLDGVVLSRAAEAFSDLADIERIEVLRGPQGTLFGKNASAGVINIVSKRPGDAIGGYVEGGFFTGNGNEYRVRAAIDLPLSDKILTRTTGYYGNYAGNIFNIAPNVNRRVNGNDRWGIRSMLVASPSEDVTITLIGDYHRYKDDCCADVIAGPPLFGSTSATPGAVNTTALALIQTVLPTLQGNRTRTVNQNLVTKMIETGYGFSGQLDATLGTQTVTSITAYRNFANNELRDGDFYPQAFIGAPQSHDTGPQTGYSFTQELRLTSPTNQFFEYVAGVFYSYTKTKRVFRRDNTICAAATGAVLPVGVLTPCTSPLAAPSVTAFGQSTYGANAKNLAFYAQGTLNLAERFRFIGGLRYTTDQLDVDFIRITSAGNLASNPPLDQGVFDSRPNAASNGSPAAANGIPYRTKTTASNWSGKAGVQFDFSRGSTGYASYTRGYKGPAYNLFFNLQPTGSIPLEPETSTSYEIGLKNTLFGGKLTINLAAYYAKYENFQANNPDTLTINNVTTTIGRFTNAGTVSTRGVEFDFALRPVRDLSISGGLAYTDARVDAFRIPAVRTPNDIIPNGTPLGFAPKWKGSLLADYRIRTGGAIDVGLGAQASVQSSQLSLFVADPVQRANGVIAGYALVNLSASIIDSEDRYRITFQARNVLDQSFAATISTGGPSGAYRYQIPRDADRYFGVTARLNFGGK
jgi:iron complex outermembrane recepter protein